MTDVVVLGSGMAAWGAHDRLVTEGIHPRMFDANEHAGGHTASETLDGFVWDEGPHISFTAIAEMQEIMAVASDHEYETQIARVDNYYQGVWVKHPAIAFMHGLPPKLVMECIRDFVETSATPAPETFANYHEWLLATYGRTFADTFPSAYGRKYHTVGPEGMDTSWLGPRLFRPQLEEVLSGALGVPQADKHYLTDFRYPKGGGFFRYLSKFAETADLSLSHRATAIDPTAKTIRFANGVTTTYDRLISSVPLPVITKMLPAPVDVQNAAALLSCSQCVVVNFGIDREDISDHHWRYIYDEDMASVRLSFPSLFSPTTAPPGCGSVQVEVYFSDKYKPLTQTPDSLIPVVRAELSKMGVLREGDNILHESAKYIPFANVIFDLDSGPCSRLVRDYLASAGIESCGRYGDWAYIWTDQSFLSGRRAAQSVLDAMSSN